LDHGLQRALAVNLSTLLPTDRVRLSTWRPEDVSVEVYVGVEQFDVDDSGHAVLVAQWRTQSPAGRGIQKAGQFRGQRSSESPFHSPGAAAAAMSELVAELSREIAQAITSAAR
jgi:uncharacterized lipoprotein YmbA